MPTPPSDSTVHGTDTSFVGREDVLAEVDRQLAAISSGWVLIIGGPGTGKSAILSEYLVRRDRAPDRLDVPRHFIRRNTHGSQPHVIISALATQVERRFSAQRNPDAEPATRLVELLTRVSHEVLAPRGEHLDIVVDGLNEVDADAARTPLPRFLPQPLPPGVRFLGSTRPEQPHLDWLLLQRGVCWIDLDTTWAPSNHDTVTRYWSTAAVELRLPIDTVKRLVTAADGNILHAVMVRDAIKSPPPGWSLDRLPPGIVGLVRELWERCATDAPVAVALGLLCAAREALPLGLLGDLAGWHGADRGRFLRAARPLLLEKTAPGSVTYHPRHDWIRQQLVDETGAIPMRVHHRKLADQLATWPLPAQPDRRQYALRHALNHRAGSGDWTQAWRLAADMAFLEAKCRELGVHEAEADVARAAERCRASGDRANGKRLDDLARALARESHRLRNAPAATAELVWNRLRRSGWSADDIDGQLTIPASTTFLRVNHGPTRDSPALVRDLVGHARRVTACTVTPEGRRVVSASDDETLKLWDLDTGRELATLRGHTNRVTACAATPDGGRVVSASDDTTLRLWDLATGRVLATFEGHVSRVNACAVAPGGRHVLSASSDRTLKLWDLDTGRLVTSFHGHANSVYACAVTPDGRRAISASEDRTLKLWDLGSGGLIATFQGHAGAVTACAAATDSRRVISASRDETLKIWNLDTGGLLATFQGHASRATACATTPDGSRVVSASEDHTLKVWNLDGGGVLATFQGHAGKVTACAVTPDGRRVISASDDRTLKVWDLDNVRVLPSFEGHAGLVTACAVTRNGRRVISASYDRTLKLWGLDSGRALATVGVHAGRVNACAVTPDDRWVVSASEDHTLKIWDLHSGLVLATLEGHDGAVNACAVTPDGRRVVSAAGDYMLSLWELDSGDLLGSFEGHAAAVHACAITRDGRRVVSASEDQTLRVWDLELRRALATVGVHADRVNACAVTPDDRRVISASVDQTLKVWDLHTGRELATLEGHTGAVTACAVTPDGRRVVSASGDHTLKVWDLETYACLLTHRGESAYTAVAATGAAVVAGDAAGSVWFLDWPASMASAAAVSSAPLAEARAAAASPPATPRRSKAPHIRHAIAFLAADPTGTTRLALAEQCAAIERELRMTAGRDDFDFRSKWAVSVDELMRHLNELQPIVIHFSGHGGTTGIHLQDEHGHPQHVTARALTQMIESAAPSARVVVLNACFSDAQAEPLRGVVDCVVGMRGAIDDAAARSFAVGFYRALGYRRSVGNAVAQAVATLAAKQLPDEHLPVCRTRDGVSADQVFLPDLGPRRP